MAKNMLFYWVIVALFIGLLLAGCGKEPSIDVSLSANETSLEPGDTCSITASVSYDGDASLSYDWSSTGGQLDGSSENATWTAPEEVGSYTISLAVSDGEVSADASIAVEVDTVNYFPLAVGNSWTFQVTKTDTSGSTEYSETQSINCITTMDSQDWFVMYTTTSDSSLDSIYYRKGSEYLYGGYVFLDAFLGFPAAPIKPEIGDEWETIDTLGIFEVSIVGEVVSFDTLTVPAGEYECYQASLIIDAGVISMDMIYWFSNGVGPVRIMQIDDADTTDRMLESYSLIE